MIYAEVIGDPIAQSKSPIIHKHWLRELRLEGDYVRTHVAADDLSAFLSRRRSERNWRGCNITIPHKQAIIRLLDRLGPEAEAIGAVNCVVPSDGALLGYNTDIDGVSAALDSTELRSRKAALIGAGGSARAVVAYLASRRIRQIAILVRKPERAETLRALTSRTRMDILPFDQADVALGGAAAIINASPLGMTGADPMPRSLLEAIRSHAAGSTVFDLVATPLETDFLRAGRAGGGRPVDGLTMLVGQAARAFELFFGSPAPPPDDDLRGLLVTDSYDSD